MRNETREAWPSFVHVRDTTNQIKVYKSVGEFIQV